MSDTPALDTSNAHPARRYNYWLGGKDNFAADRESGEEIAKRWPFVRIGARENRDFMIRAAQHLAGLGIHQFMDIGAGLPAGENLHAAVQGIIPTARVVYADNDPLVLVHARALMWGTAEGKIVYADADLREPGALLRLPEVRETLDWNQPIALMLIAILHFITDDDDPKGIVTTLVDALPAGSWIVASHGTAEFDDDPEKAKTFARETFNGWLRDRDQFAALFEHPRIQLVDPELPMVSRWWRETKDVQSSDKEVSVRGLVAQVL